MAHKIIETLQYTEAEVREYIPRSARSGHPGAGEGALRAGTQKAALLAVYASGEDMADFEAAAKCGLYRAHVNYWHRVGDLIDDGFLADTGERRRNPDTGKERRVARITEAGRRAFASPTEHEETTT